MTVGGLNRPTAITPTFHPTPDEVRIALLSRPDYLLNLKDWWQPAANGPLNQPASVHFGVGAKHAAYTDAPPSVTFDILSKSRQTLHLRRWFPYDSNPEDRQIVGKPDGKPVILLIHGLGSRSDWQAPLVQQLIKPQQQTSKQPMAFYGIDLPQIGQHAYQNGHFDRISELTIPIQETIDRLAKRHGGPVYAIGTSMGGLLLTKVAADPKTSPALAGIALISPAFKQNDELLKSIPGRLKAKLSLKRPDRKTEKPVLKTRPTDSEAFLARLNPLQRRMRLEQTQVQDKIQDLTVSSYARMFTSMLKARMWDVRKITIPVRVFMTDTEPNLDPAGTKEAFERLASKNKRLVVYPKADHNLMYDPCLPDVARHLNRWLDDFRQ